MTADFVQPDWSLNARVRALTTRRYAGQDGGASSGPWAGFNLGDHVGDRPQAVAANRDHLQTLAGLPARPQWLEQVHGTRTVALPDPAPPVADAAFTTAPGVVCAVLTADCLPVFVAARDGSVVGLAHAGWRGLAAGVIESLLARLPCVPAETAAWLGPAIGPEAFQVGDEVRAACLRTDPGAEEAFRPDGPGYWRADLWTLARRRLASAGVPEIAVSGECTYSNPDHYFSHRRKAPCGRMASLIWIERHT